ncbi:alpha/beta fold hydrolase [Gordonia sp. NPDC003424]
MAWFEHGTSRIYYEESPGDETVLLLGGFGDRIEGHLPLRNALTENGFRVIAADLPGSGRSQPIPRRYPTGFYEDDAEAFTALLRHLDAAPAHLLGWSTGGEIALVMATSTPAIARSVLTWGAAGVLNDPDGQVVATMNQLIDNPIPPLKDYSDYMIATYGADTARTMVQGQGTAITEILRTRSGDLSLSRADRIECPVLLIAGEYDFFAPLPHLERFAARNPNVTTLQVADAGHDIHMSRPEWFVQTVTDWLNRQRRVGS